MSDRIQVRSGTSAEWAASNPILAVAEPGFDTTTGDFRIGDGVSSWSLLPATGGASGLSTPFDLRYVLVAGGVVLTDAAQTFTTAVAADITWGTEVSDLDGWTAGGIATLTVPVGKAGRYVISFTGKWSADPGTLGAVVLSINGTNIIEDPATRTTSFAFSQVITLLQTLAAGDTFKFTGFQSSGSNKDLVSRLEIAPV